MDVREGSVFKFKVVTLNALGREITNPNQITVASGASLGVVDAAAGTYTAGSVDGADTLIATDGTLMSAPYSITVVADNVPASLEIQPA